MPPTTPRTWPRAIAAKVALAGTAALAACMAWGGVASAAPTPVTHDTYTVTQPCVGNAGARVTVTGTYDQWSQGDRTWGLVVLRAPTGRQAVFPESYVTSALAPGISQDSGMVVGPGGETYGVTDWYLVMGTVDISHGDLLEASSGRLVDLCPSLGIG